MPYQLRRSRRRRTLGLTVTESEVRIHAPVWTSRDEIETYVVRQHAWLARAWRRMQARAPRAEAEPAALRYLGHALHVVVRTSLFPEIRRRGRTLYIYAEPDADPHALARDWLIACAERLLAWRLARLARRLGRAPSYFALSDARTQWRGPITATADPGPAAWKPKSPSGAVAPGAAISVSTGGLRRRRSR